MLIAYYYIGFVSYYNSAHVYAGCAQARIIWAGTWQYGYLFIVYATCRVQDDALGRWLSEVYEYADSLKLHCTCAFIGITREKACNQVYCVASVRVAKYNCLSVDTSTYLWCIPRSIFSSGVIFVHRFGST